VEDCDIAGLSGAKPQTEVRNLLTVGTPNMGFTEIPAGGCQELALKKGMAPLCAFEKTILNDLAYTPAIQSTVSCAGFYRNTNNIDEYKKGSTFLASLNNEVGQGSETYEKHRKRIQGLNQAMFVMFDQDEIVYPQSSEIFGQVTPKDKEGK
jgi:hypothetical protein